MKGELEAAVKKLNFESISIFQPPILDRENSDRFGEKIAVFFGKFFGKFFVLIRPLKPKILAKLMIKVAIKQEKGIQIYSPKEIFQMIEK